MSDLMTSTIIDGVVEMMRLPAYQEPGNALREYMARQGMFKGKTPMMALNSQIILSSNLRDLNANLSQDEAMAFAEAIEKAEDNSVALMAMTNALEFENV